MLAEIFASKIKSRRTELNITQPHLADMAGISVNTLYKIEKGTANPTLAVIEKLFDILGLEILINPKKTG